ncbi:MAG: hypothetical protein NT062_08215 [Proteobacteria bacterium]|nr:hypothetical protein [Pseudomonadota bacterium]
MKPKIASRPSTPLPPPPPPPPAARDELGAPRDIARLLRYGERFGDKRIDIRMQPQLALPITGAIAIFDPAAPRSVRVFDRPTGPGNFRVMLSVAVQDGKPERLAALIIHVGRPPIAKWTVAHYARDKKPKSPDALPRLATSGWLAVIDGATTPSALPTSTPTSVTPVVHGAALAVPCGTGEFAAYWAVDATDKPICLVIDFDVLTAKDWKTKPAA